MKKTLATIGILVLSLGIVGAAAAGEQCNKTAATSCNKSAASVAEARHCPSTAAKAAYASSLESSGCEATAKAAYANAM
ncbi:MAG: hypothetical protein QNL91_13500, partial [Candidatus Krumholzibacteria bacterium]|nr:hypothetical protein [Candidatus Krumholzibacteria bacterium]